MEKKKFKVTFRIDGLVHTQIVHAIDNIQAVIDAELYVRKKLKRFFELIKVEKVN